MSLKKLKKEFEKKFVTEEHDSYSGNYPVVLCGVSDKSVKDLWQFIEKAYQSGVKYGKTMAKNKKV